MLPTPSGMTRACSPKPESLLPRPANTSPQLVSAEPAADALQGQEKVLPGVTVARNTKLTHLAQVRASLTDTGEEGAGSQEKRKGSPPRPHVAPLPLPGRLHPPCTPSPSQLPPACAPPRPGLT